MPKITTEDFRLKEHYYYIVDFRNLMQPELIPAYYVNKNLAKRVLKANVPSRLERKKYSIIRGKQIKDENLSYNLGIKDFGRRGTKYDYPPGIESKKDKRNYRILMRRRLRRMGLYSKPKAKFKYNEEKAKKVKPEENRQIRGVAKKTQAKVFRIDRKPRYYYYIVLKKRLSSKRGKLFKIKAIKVNIKTGEFKVVTIHTMKNDLLMPELISNLEKIENAKEAVAYFWAYKRKQKKVSG